MYFFRQRDCFLRSANQTLLQSKKLAEKISCIDFSFQRVYLGSAPDQCPYNDACSSNADCENSACGRLLVCGQVGPLNGRCVLDYTATDLGEGMTFTDSEEEEEQTTSFDRKKLKKFGPFQISVDVNIEPRSHSE